MLPNARLLKTVIDVGKEGGVSHRGLYWSGVSDYSARHDGNRTEIQYLAGAGTDTSTS
jgi:hypothetical protein